MIGTLQNVIKERKQTDQVNEFLKLLLRSIFIYLFNLICTKLLCYISYTKQVNGRQVPTWNPAEVEEIITSQLFYQSK